MSLISTHLLLHLISLGDLSEYCTGEVTSLSVNTEQNINGYPRLGLLHKIHGDLSELSLAHEQEIGSSLSGLGSIPV